MYSAGDISCMRYISPIPVDNFAHTSSKLRLRSTCVILFVYGSIKIYFVRVTNIFLVTNINLKTDDSYSCFTIRKKIDWLKKVKPLFLTIKKLSDCLNEIFTDKAGNKI